MPPKPKPKKTKLVPGQKTLREFLGAAKEKPGAALDGLGLSVNARTEKAKLEVRAPVSLRCRRPSCIDHVLNAGGCFLFVQAAQLKAAQDKLRRERQRPRRTTSLNPTPPAPVAAAVMPEPEPVI